MSGKIFLRPQRVHDQVKLPRINVMSKHQAAQQLLQRDLPIHDPEVLIWSRDEVKQSLSVYYKMTLFYLVSLNQGIREAVRVV